MPLPRGLRVIQNPPNPWSSTSVEYLEAEPGAMFLERAGEGAPIARLEVIEDATRNILAENSSPDIGFRYSVNPYRGCFHACAYCLSGDTRILMANGSQKELRDLRPGDEVLGTCRTGRYRRYVRSTVLDAWKTVKPAFRVSLSDGTAIIASPDHRFLTKRGWKYVTGSIQGPGRRPHLTVHDELLGTGGFAAPPTHSHDYKLGYLCGVIRGDGLLRQYDYDRPGRSHGRQFQFRLALVDDEPLVRTGTFLAELGVPTHRFKFAGAKENRRALMGIRTNARGGFERLQEIVCWPSALSLDWAKGFLAGIFDAEGCYSEGVLRISNTQDQILQKTMDCFALCGFDAVLERSETRASTVRVRGGLKEHLRFFHTTEPSIERKRFIEGRAFKSRYLLRVESAEPLGFDLLMFDITTSTGDFIADGVVSHNCYARPQHEYLSLGAGTDFDRKLVVKPEAPVLLKEAFDKPSWAGEFIMFSGDTDCYQPLEASYRLTRRCLEVCAEYRNPCAVITKSPLIERDIDVLVALAKVTHFGVTISIPLWDVHKARAIEPFVATPQRRIHIIEKLATAGIEVGVNIAPMIPGLGDEDMPFILRAAKDAGATRAGFVFLRLPGPVAGIFEERLRQSLPLRADKVMARVREGRGGKVYDSRWGVRQRGQGPYAEMARALFDAEVKRLGLRSEHPSREEETTFRRPAKKGDQLGLF